MSYKGSGVGIGGQGSGTKGRIIDLQAQLESYRNADGAGSITTVTPVVPSWTILGLITKLHRDGLISRVAKGALKDAVLSYTVSADLLRDGVAVDGMAVEMDDPAMEVRGRGLYRDGGGGGGSGGGGSSEGEDGDAGGVSGVEGVSRVGSTRGTGSRGGRSGTGSEHRVELAGGTTASSVSFDGRWAPRDDADGVDGVPRPTYHRTQRSVASTSTWWSTGPAPPGDGSYAGSDDDSGDASEAELASAYVVPSVRGDGAGSEDEDDHGRYGWRSRGRERDVDSSMGVDDFGGVRTFSSSRGSTPSLLTRARSDGAVVPDTVSAAIPDAAAPPQPPLHVSTPSGVRFSGGAGAGAEKVSPVAAGRIRPSSARVRDRPERADGLRAERPGIPKRVAEDDSVSPGGSAPPRPTASSREQRRRHYRERRLSEGPDEDEFEDLEGELDAQIPEVPDDTLLLVEGLQVAH